MTEQDPQFGPLRRLDPAEPEERDLGRLEPLDPEADEGAPELLASPPRPPSRAGDGLALAVAIAVLLSLSSIAAIGGLVAISAQSLAPSAEPAMTAPIEAAAGVPTIRVSVPSSGRERPQRPAGEAAAAAAPAVAADAAPAPAPPPVPSGSGGSAGQDEDRGGKDGGGGGGKPLGPRGVGGAWCDAGVGSACDAVVGGTTSSSQGDAGEGQIQGVGYIPEEQGGQVIEAEGP